jgi:hypothetical protein
LLTTAMSLRPNNSAVRSAGTVAQRGKASACGQPDVTRADHRDPPSEHGVIVTDRADIGK